MPKPKSRILVDDLTINEALADVVDKLRFRVSKKGSYSYISTHEALGLITEEYWELIEAVKNNDDEEIIHELKDIAVGCIFAIASMKQYNTPIPEVELNG